MITQTEKCLRMRVVAQIIGVSPVTIYRYIREGSFPAQIKIGKRAVAWRASDIDAWIKSRGQVGAQNDNS